MTPLASVALGVVAHRRLARRSGLGVVDRRGRRSRPRSSSRSRASRASGRSRGSASPAWSATTHASPREAGGRWVGVAISWVLRALAVFVLLAALGFGVDFARRSRSSARRRPRPSSRRSGGRGGAGRRGCGDPRRLAACTPTDAVAFGIAAQALLMAAGAAFVLALGALARPGALSRSPLSRSLRAASAAASRGGCPPSTGRRRRTDAASLS